MTTPSLASSLTAFLVASLIAAPLTTLSAASVENTVQRELARRYNDEARGREALVLGDKAMKERDYPKAVEFYRQAVKLIPNAANTRKSYDGALRKFCDASVKLAEQRITEGRYADAEGGLRDVVDNYDPKCKQAIVILARLETPDYYNKTITPKFRSNVEQVKQWFVEAEGYYRTGRFDLAFKRCEQILNLDRYNIAAQQMKEKIDRAMSDTGLAGYNESRARAMRDVDLGWSRPLRRFNLQGPVDVVSQVDQNAGNVARIQKKLERIIIPKLELREATIREAVDFLKQKSKDLDTTEENAANRGVNIVLKLEGGGGSPLPEAAPAQAAPAIPGLEPVPGAAAPAAAAAALPAVDPNAARVTVQLTNIPLIEALRYVTGLANLKFKVEPFAVSIVPQGVSTDVLLNREWKVRPDLISRAPSAAGGGEGLAAPKAAAPADASKGGSGIGQIEAAKDWLTAYGILFPSGASAVYIPSTSRLIVRNTQEMLDQIDTIIASGGGTGPQQVDVEAKFIEITQNNLKELSFDWLLGPSNTPGNKHLFFGGGTPGFQPQINAGDFPFVQNGTPVGQNPVTAGNRSGQLAISANAIDALLFGSSGASALAPSALALSGVFTDPQFQVVIRALNQKKGVDLLSAPRVTTKSGQRAVIEIIREFRYPTEFEPPQIPQNFGSQGGNINLGAGVGQSPRSFPVTPTTPTAFETRNTGVTLEVEPVIGPDGYTIDLNLIPQVVEFEGFINYGSPIQTTGSNPITGVPETTVITPNVINQPIFSTRKVTTSVSIFDGQTVALGGLMREDVQKVEDKIPFLGDIPLIGRLFRSNVDQHLKRNLVIFVSARLMNPAGDPVRIDEEKEELVEILPPPEVNLPSLELPLMPK